MSNRNVWKKWAALCTLVVVCVTTLFALCGCFRIAGNYPTYYYDEFAETDRGFVYKDYGTSVEVSVANKTYAQTDTSDAVQGNFLEGGTAPRYDIHAPNGYEGAVKHIEDLEIDEYSVVDTRGYVKDGKLLGYVNVFYKTIGYLSGGGNYGVEEISHGIVFSYDPATDTFTQVKCIEECVIVAQNDNIVLYWKDRNYYSYNIETNTETFLVEDKAYDVGIQHQSRTAILTNSQYTVIHMVKAMGIKETDYFYLYDYSANEIYLLNKLEERQS